MKRRTNPRRHKAECETNAKVDPRLASRKATIRKLTDFKAFPIRIAWVRGKVEKLKNGTIRQWWKLQPAFLKSEVRMAQKLQA